MRPKDIHTLYNRESSATDDEAAQTEQEARTNPDTARAMLQTAFALTSTDGEFAMLVQLATQRITRQMILERAMTDDAFALQCSATLFDVMAAMKPGSAVRTPRGKVKPSA